MNKPLLILDLDETLWYGIVSDDNYSNVFYLRPHLRHFIDTVSPWYDLAVWTAATLDWAEEGLATIKREIDLDLRSKLVFLWDRSHTTETVDSTPYAFSSSVRRIKEGRLIEASQYGAKYPMSRIMAVDDYQQNYQNIINNYIPITEWLGDLDDDELLNLADFLVAIKDQPDFRKVAKMNWRP
jgi:carboxy-terminal domain RNA polymerase II polypeptide A small phosphatase